MKLQQRNCALNIRNFPFLIKPKIDTYTNKSKIVKNRRGKSLTRDMSQLKLLISNSTKKLSISKGILNEPRNIPKISDKNKGENLIINQKPKKTLRSECINLIITLKKKSVCIN